MRRYLLIASAITAVLFIGCATTITTRMVTQPAPNTIDTQTLLDAVTFVLVDNGFDIRMVNQSFGLVTTEWRPVNSGSDTAANILGAFSAGMSGGPMTTYSRVMMFQIQITNAGYTLVPKVMRSAKTSSMYGNSSDQNVEYPSADQPEGQLAEKIIEEINQLLGLPDTYTWGEKTIEIEW